MTTFRARPFSKAGATFVAALFVMAGFVPAIRP
jgi:hypothetical protein